MLLIHYQIACKYFAAWAKKVKTNGIFKTLYENQEYKIFKQYFILIIILKCFGYTGLTLINISFIYFFLFSSCGF